MLRAASLRFRAFHVDHGESLRHGLQHATRSGRVRPQALGDIMAAFIILVAVLQIVAGVVVAITAKSAIHEILGAIAFGMGVISFALAIIIAKLDDFMKMKRD